MHLTCVLLLRVLNYIGNLKADHTAHAAGLYVHQINEGLTAELQGVSSE